MNAYVPLVALMAALLSGCSTLSYYTHTVSGQLRLLAKREPIAAAIDNHRGQGELVKDLKRVKRIRAFASQRLRLPDNDSYRSYVDLDRPYVTWSVFVAPAFSLTLRQWCFPIAGCVAYRGYFSEQRARAFAAKRAQQGLDVYVAGVPAYSTLGWFDDPVLSTMVARGEIYTAEIIFHELAHQRVYVKDDTAFNEAFAVAVQRSGVQRWLAHQGEPRALGRYRQLLMRRQGFFGLIQDTRQSLARVYNRPVGDAAKRAAKQRALADMQVRYRRLKRTWGGSGLYDQWFAHAVNNAQLASIALYQRLVPAFLALLADCEGRYACFYKRVEALSELDPQARETCLRQAVKQSPPAG